MQLYQDLDAYKSQPTDRPLRTKRGHRKATPPASSAPTSQQPTPAHQQVTQPGIGTFTATTSAPPPHPSPDHTAARPSSTQSFLQTVGAQPPLNGASTTLPPLSQLQSQHQPYDTVTPELTRAPGTSDIRPQITNGPQGTGEITSRVEDEAEAAAAAAAASLAGMASGGEVNGPPAGGDTEMRDAGAQDDALGGFTAVNR